MTGSPPTAARPRFALVAALLAVFGFVAFGRAVWLPLFDHDSWTLIGTSRPSGFGDLFGLFVEPFMGGRFGEAFHRPVHALWVGLQALLFGLEPAGYQAVQVAVWIAAALAVGWLVNGLGGRVGLGERAWPGLVVAAALLLHPLGWQIVPATARGHDPLAVLLAALCLRFAFVSQRNRRTALAAGLCAFGAIGVKEVGYLLGPLGAWMALGMGDGERTRARLFDGALRLAPIAAAGALAFALRRIALTGVEGRDFAPLDPVSALRLVEFSLLPIPEVANQGWYRLLTTAALVGLAVACVAVVASGAGDRRRTSSWAVAALLLIGGAALLPTLRGGWREWHGYLPLVGLWLALGLPLAFLATSTRGRPRTSALVGFALLPWPILVALQWNATRVLSLSDQWRESAEMAERFIARFESELEVARPGDQLQYLDLPIRGAIRTAGPRMLSPSLFAGQSLRSWVEMRFPERPIRVLGPPAIEGRSPERVTVVLGTDVLDFSRTDHRWRRGVEALRQLGPQWAQKVERFTVGMGQGRYVEAKRYLVDFAVESGPAGAEARRDLAAFFEYAGDSRALDRLRAADR